MQRRAALAVARALCNRQGGGCSSASSSSSSSSAAAAAASSSGRTSPCSSSALASLRFRSASSAPMPPPPPPSNASRLFDKVPPPSTGADAARSAAAGKASTSGRTGAAAPAAAAAAEAMAAAASHAPPPSSPALTAVRRALGFAALATGSAAAWLTWSKTLDEVDEMVAALEKEEEEKMEGKASSSIETAVAAADATSSTSSSSTSSSTSSPSLAARLLLPPLRYYRDKRAAASSTIASYADPPTDRLLPDLPRNASHVRTLVLDLDGVLVQSDWRRGRGWRTFKRPGVDAFLQAASQYYELVLYTDHLPTYADPILDRLDPRRLIQYRLYRDSTRYVPSATGDSGPQHARDLASLNRDPRRVLFVTASREAARGPSTRENAVLIPEWGGTADDKMDPADTGLLDLLPFLEALFRTDVPDVRPVVESYGGEPVGPAFRRRMMELEAKKKKGGAGRRGGGGSGGAGGGSGGGTGQGRFAFFRN